MGQRKRIALYGGTFDPVHRGHLSVARSLTDVFQFDHVLFIPAALAPHKRGARVTPVVHRYAMLALATQDEPRFSISTVEIDAPEQPFTVDTLARLQTELSEKARLFFVMGADSWMDITTWRCWERVLTLTDQIVVTRPGYPWSVAHVTSGVQARVVDLRGHTPGAIGEAVDQSNDGTRIYITDAVMSDVSATAIRRAIGQRATDAGTAYFATLLSSPVFNYIEKYNLYRDVEA